MSEYSLLVLSLLPAIVIIVAWRHVNKSQLSHILKPTVIAFYAGFLFKSGLDMWRQDLLGLEAYIVLVKEYWLDVPVIVGFAVTAFALLLFAYAVRRLKGQFYIGDKCAGKNDL